MDSNVENQQKYENYRVQMLTPPLVLLTTDVKICLLPKEISAY